MYVYIYIYIHIHVFHPSQDSSVWLGLMSREQLMSPECSKHQVLSFAKMLVVWWKNKKYSVLISVLQSPQWIKSERMHRWASFYILYIQKEAQLNSATICNNRYEWKFASANVINLSIVICLRMKFLLFKKDSNLFLLLNISIKLR